MCCRDETARPFRLRRSILVNALLLLAVAGCAGTIRIVNVNLPDEVDRADFYLVPEAYWDSGGLEQTFTQPRALQGYDRTAAPAALRMLDGRYVLVSVCGENLNRYSRRRIVIGPGSAVHQVRC